MLPRVDLRRGWRGVMELAVVIVVAFVVAMLGVATAHLTDGDN